MASIEKWAQMFESHNHMARHTGLSWMVCKKLRTGKLDGIRSDTLKLIRLLVDTMSPIKSEKAILHLLGTSKIPKRFDSMIKIMAISVVAKHKIMQGVPNAYKLCLTWPDVDVFGGTTFFASLDKAERLLFTLYKRYPRSRSKLFGGTGFIELMKMYGENFRNVRHFKVVNVSPANSLCEPLNEGESQ